MNNFVGVGVAVVASGVAVWVHYRWHRGRAEEKLRVRPKLSPTQFGRQYFGERDARATLAAEVREIISHYVPYSLDGLHPQDQFVEDLHMDALDSMSTVELVLEIEKRYGIDIPDEEAQRVRTVGELVDYLDHRLNG